MPVGTINDDVKALAQRMTVTMKENDVPGVGLAAPQVGVNLRLIVVDTRPDGKSSRKKPPTSPGEMMLNPLMPVALVNPEIITTGHLAHQASHDTPDDKPMKKSQSFRRSIRSCNGLLPVSSSTPQGMWFVTTPDPVTLSLSIQMIRYPIFFR